MTQHGSAPAPPWWRGATIYQIYPRSFADSNGDGVGDLAGITERLDYVASLGVDAIWLSPFFASPMRDFGYDISDYRAVDPLFGTLAEFDALIERARAVGLKVVIDQVYAHTSDQHPWFVESRSDGVNPRADWYVWADPKPDGGPPSNWQSVFGGPAWTWDARRRQYFLHNFLKEQPQLNGHNPQVQAELLDTARFWLERGVDGFRLDAINFLMHDPALTDNPPAPDDGKPRTRPFDYQQRLYNQGHGNILPFLERFRALLDSYGGRFTVAEVGGEDAPREMRAFTGPGRLDSAYGFDFLYAPELSPAVVREAMENWPDAPGVGWPSWAFENHDAPRAVSRWVAAEHRDAFARVKIMLLAALRGNIFLYQGQELGLTQVEIPFEELCDPEAIANWPLTLSRDGARTPMPWLADEAGLGFSPAKPWLRFGPDHGPLAVDRQERDPRSLLAHTRAMVALRRTAPALRLGRLEWVAPDGPLLAFDRVCADQRVRCIVNLTPQRLPWRGLPTGHSALASVGEITEDRIGPFAGLLATVPGPPPEPASAEAKPRPRRSG